MVSSVKKGISIAHNHLITMCEILVASQNYFPENVLPCADAVDINLRSSTSSMPPCEKHPNWKEFIYGYFLFIYLLFFTIVYEAIRNFWSLLYGSNRWWRRTFIASDSHQANVIFSVHPSLKYFEAEV